MSLTWDIHSLNIGKPKTLQFGDKPFTTGVGKHKVERAFLTKNGFEGDGVFNTKHHGGEDRAVLFYCLNHYEKWNKQFNTNLQIPGFGENMTVGDLSEENVWIGDVFQVGETVIQITQPRFPCDTLSKYNSEDALLMALIDTGYTGYLGRVIKEGWIEMDSKIELMDRNKNSVSIKEANDAFYHNETDVEVVKKIVEIPELAEVMRGRFQGKLNKLTK